MRDSMLAGRTLPGTKVAAKATVVDYVTTNRLQFSRAGVRKQAEAVSIMAVNPATNEPAACDIKVLINAGAVLHATIKAAIELAAGTTQTWFLWNPKNQGPLNLSFYDRKTNSVSQFIDTIDFLPYANTVAVAADTDIYCIAAER